MGIFGQTPADTSSQVILQLPPPNTKGTMSLEETIAHRRSVRSFREAAISIQDLSQLLWSAQGITSTEGLRAAPSAGALFPMEIYAVVSNVTDIEAGFYKYNPFKNVLYQKAKGNFKEALSGSALEQDSIKNAAVNIIICADFERITQKYRDRGIRYVWMEAGHIAENIMLQCESLGLGTVCIGAFSDYQLEKLMASPETPLYILPVGNK